MSKELPKFVMDYLEDYLGCEFKGIPGRRTYKVTREGEAVIRFFKFISQPENVAKIPVVKALIDANELEVFYYQDMGTGDTFTRKGFNHEKIKKALEPFKREGGDV